ncbi:MAG: hypothetical protein ACLQD8_07240 [Thermoplasmata archaeon]
MARSGRPLGFGRAGQWVLVASIALLIAMPAADAAGVGARPTTVNALAAPATTGLGGPHATWGGTNLSAASTEAHAFGISANQQIVNVFTYTIHAGGPNVTLARIQAFYFGAVISTDQVSTVNHPAGGGVEHGTGTMNWGLGTFTYLLAGVYLLTASLVDANGSTVWSENFYIDATAVDHIASGLIIFLLVLGLVELYSILTVGRSVRRRPKTVSSPPTPWEHPSETGSAAGGATTPESPPPPPVTPPEGSP